MVTRLKSEVLKPKTCLSTCSFSSSYLPELEPKNAKAAMTDSRWLIKATHEEFQALQQNHA